MEEINVLVKVTKCIECPYWHQNVPGFQPNIYCYFNKKRMDMTMEESKIVIHPECPWRKKLWNTKRA